MNEAQLAKRMFLAGCAGLPWLWICNSLYFRPRVFDPLPVVDYWPWDGRGKSDAYVRHADAKKKSDGEDEGGDGTGSDSGSRGEGFVNDGENAAAVQGEVEKWVRRSTRGAVLVLSVFTAWIVAFQVNKDSFGPKWFVMSEDEAVSTGW